MFAQVISAVVLGIEAELIEVQCDVAHGFPGFSVVGLPEKEVTESRERIRSAIKNSGYLFPTTRITANLAPADLRKEGVGFDLPIALGLIIASQQLPVPTRRYLILGELALNGEVRAVKGALPIALRAAADGNIDGIILPLDNAAEAALVNEIPVYPVSTLSEASKILSEEVKPVPFSIDREAIRSAAISYETDFAEIKGQEQAKRALEVAAVGDHNVLMVGPPGAGKSMLSRRFPTIQPPLSFEEALNTTKIYSIIGMIPPGQSLLTTRPFRAPHHTISYAGMVGGGGGIPRPGEITLAHHGVLFLDELPEFDRHVLETLRQPLEDREIVISRAGVSVSYPANFMLLAAMNPCPCGHRGDKERECTCTSQEIHRYRKRISGPFLDRIDIFIEVPRLTSDELLSRPTGESSAAIRSRVERARKLRAQRLAEEKKDTNRPKQTDHAVEKNVEDYQFDSEGRKLLAMAIDHFSLSARGYTRLLRVARTIADLSASALIRVEHLSEAIQYRSIDENLL
ncbi:YifB family Mg chelatase-like AAA ATPase [Candidatus Acetothermia bacterium]|jgi:magnesium chelatase family protein|nr:YifB family Mg chelatase-like AAA ATPase [Candidatus Acetothermia bacterium]MCI2427148.1 YifB family Mg chelatase-like AAA ATPase [Candidatus Acetothermia bacterium]MCI2428670.1 YifB family Mg chelatase-like AAA ATPase [Candidatus Acetothermia bacterium]